MSTPVKFVNKSNIPIKFKFSYLNIYETNLYNIYTAGNITYIILILQSVIVFISTNKNSVFYIIFIIHKIDLTNSNNQKIIYYY